MKEIPLTQGKVALVDDEDYEWLNQWKWRFGDYAIRTLPRDSGPIRFVRMHRLIMAAPAGLEVDHINGNPLDNRRKNLRLCSHAENTRNTKIHNRTGFKGVQPNGKGWTAKIKTLGKTKYIGFYRTPEEAAKAYDQKAVELFGEFARTNF